MKNFIKKFINAIHLSLSPKKKSKATMLYILTNFHTFVACIDSLDTYQICYFCMIA